MGLNPAHRFDAARRAKRETEQIRQLRKRPHGHAETKTFVVGGDITADMYIPPAYLAVDPDDTIPEVKQIVAVAGVLETGTAQVWWYLDGILLTDAEQTITSTPADGLVTLAAPVAVNGIVPVQIAIISATSATNLSAAVVIVTRQA